MENEITLTGETRAIVEHYLTKKRKKWEEKHGTKEEETVKPIITQSCEPYHGKPIIALHEKPDSDFQIIDAFMRSLRFIRTIMTLQESRRANYPDYEQRLRAELADLKAMDGEVLKIFGYEEAVSNIEQYLKRY